MISTITLDTYKQQIGSGDAFNLSDSFNGRVGDEQVPLVVHFKERGLPQQFDDGLVPFMSGFVGSLDENDQVTAETGEAVSYVGTSDDVVGLGRVKMNLPGTMFPQEGTFYGFMGLQNTDGKRVTTFSVWFHVYNGNPDMYVNKAPFRSELQKLLDAAQTLVNTEGEQFKAAMIDWEQRVTALLNDVDGDVAKVHTTLTAVQTKLDGLLDKITQSDLLTKADLDTNLATFKAQIDTALTTITQIDQGLFEATDVDGGIPAYMGNPLETARAQVDTGLFNLGFGTDYHYDIGTSYNPFSASATAPSNMPDLWNIGLRKALNLLSLSDTLDAVVFNGDNTDEPAYSDVTEERKAMIKEQADFATTAFTASESPVFLMKGNHDNNQDQSATNHTLANAITDEDFDKLYHQSDRLYGESRNGNSNYFYKDFPAKKVRLIGLDSYDLPETTNSDGTLVFNRFTTSGFQQPQLNWLANDALKVPAGYAVLLVTHAPINGTLVTNDASINHDIVKHILEDYVNGVSGQELTGTNTSVPVNIKYSFTTNGKIAAVVTGHTHTDGNATVNGINYVETRCSLTAGDNILQNKRWADYGTPLEDAFDLISVDVANSKIKFYRVGAGSEDVSYAQRQFKF